MKFFKKKKSANKEDKSVSSSKSGSTGELAPEVTEDEEMIAMGGELASLAIKEEETDERDLTKSLSSRNLMSNQDTPEKDAERGIHRQMSGKLHRRDASESKSKSGSDDGSVAEGRPKLAKRLSWTSMGSVNSTGSASGPVSRNGAPPPNLRVLVVDDDKILRKMVRQLIKRVEPSWNVKEAEDGETALKMVESEKKGFHLLFVDQYMSSSSVQKMLGTETVAELRKRGVKCKICGLSSNSLREDFYKAGADTFLVEPFPANKKLLTQVLVDMFEE